MVKPVYLVALFILLLVWGLSREAEGAEVEFGPTFLSGEFSDSAAIVLNEVWDDKWRLGMGIVGPQTVVDRSGTEYDVRTNLYVHGQRLVAITDSVDFGVGVGYFNAKTRWNGSNFVASLSIEWDIGEEGGWYTTYRHFSNAGSASPNMGQDIFHVGYKF